MMTIAKRRAWIAFATIDALLLLTTGSAMAAPAAGSAAALHVPAVLLAGLGLVGAARARPRAG